MLTAATERRPPRSSAFRSRAGDRGGVRMILPRLPQRTYRTRIAVDLSARESRIWGGEFGWSEARRRAGGEGYLLRTMVPRGVRRHRHSGVWAAASHFATPRGAKGESGRRKANDVSEDDLSKRGRRVIVRPVPPSQPVNRAFGTRGGGEGGGILRVRSGTRGRG